MGRRGRKIKKARLREQKREWDKANIEIFGVSIVDVRRIFHYVAFAVNTFSILLGFCRSRFCCFACYFIEFVFENKWKKRRRNENSLLYSILLFNTQYVYFYIVCIIRTFYIYIFFHFVYFVKCIMFGWICSPSSRAFTRSKQWQKHFLFLLFFCVHLFILTVWSSIYALGQTNQNTIHPKISDLLQCPQP